MKITIYSSDTCPNCVVVKNYLKNKGLEFEEKNIKNVTYKKEIMSMGFMSIPVTVFEKEDEETFTVVGFKREEIDETLERMG